MTSIIFDATHFQIGPIVPESDLDPRIGRAPHGSNMYDSANIRNSRFVSRTRLEVKIRVIVV